jgi:hypothetical protein
MSISCSSEAEYFLDIPEDLVTCEGTLMCAECGVLVYPGTEYCRVQEWQPADYYHPYLEEGDEIHTGVYPCCEVCGDLAMSFMELGYCWNMGFLRADIAEINDDG